MAKAFQFDYPTPELVKEYVDKFDNDNNRSDYFKDSAIIKLFEKFPNNTELDEVLAKVTLLNAFYSTQILDMDLLNVSRDIVALNIDSSIRGDNIDIDVVNRIAYDDRRLYQRKLYSFASKYCSFHNPERFPIADSYSKGMLYYMNNCEDTRFHFFTQGFTQNDLNNYYNYCKDFQPYMQEQDMVQFCLQCTESALCYQRKAVLSDLPEKQLNSAMQSVSVIH